MLAAVLAVLAGVIWFISAAHRRNAVDPFRTGACQTAEALRISQVERELILAERRAAEKDAQRMRSERNIIQCKAFLDNELPC